MSAPPFPYIGAIAPLITALLMWMFTGSGFALVGAVVAPTMVIAHHLDARRRARQTEHARVAASARDEAVRRELELGAERRRIAELNRQHPAVSVIAATPEWVPARTGSGSVRLGRFTDGSPWLVSLGGGLAVVGTGPAAESVWLSATFHARSQLGEPAGTETDQRWSDGSRIVRGSTASVARTVRCVAGRVDSLVERGCLPQSGEWEVDDTSSVREMLARLDVGEEPLWFAERDRCPVGVGLAGFAPFVLDVTNDTPHILISGRTGSGKSLALAALLLDWAERFTPDRLTLIGVDFKGGATLRRLECVANFVAIITDLDDEMVPRMLASLTVELRRREEFLAAHRAARIDDVEGLPRVAVVIDEAHEFLRQHPDGHDVLADIARRGRSLGVHLVVAVQQPTVLRESVLSNISVRVALAGNTPFDVSQVLGCAVVSVPARHHAFVTLGDGVVNDVELRVVRDSDVPMPTENARIAPPWCPSPGWPEARDGRPGFGVLDDVARARQQPAVWVPDDGDVLVIGGRRSGKTTALRRLVDGFEATWVRNLADLVTCDAPIVVIDDVDRLVAEMTHREMADFLERLTAMRATTPRVRFLYSAGAPVPRVTGGVANVLTLPLATLEEHRATGASPALWTRNGRPGTGVWNGVPVTVYASAESIDTESMP